MNTNRRKMPLFLTLTTVAVFALLLSTFLSLVYWFFSIKGGQYVASTQHRDFTVGLGKNKLNKLAIF